MPEESQIESCEYQNNANIHYQPFPDSVSEEHEIDTDYNGYHRGYVKYDSDVSAHFEYLSGYAVWFRHSQLLACMARFPFR